MDSISVEKVLHNMIVFVLHFTGNGSVVSFHTMHPAAVAVYAVIADSCNSVTNMMLIFRDPTFATRYFPQCIFFEHDIYSQPVTILVYSKLALRAHSLEPNNLTAFVSYGISFPIAPTVYKFINWIPIGDNSGSY